MTYLSVVIPTYKRNNLLGLCLDCLTAGKQMLTNAHYEVIVTDDDPEAGAKSFISENYPWVTWVHGPQKGPAANRNNGAKHAKGDWLVFLDDDCLPDSRLLYEYFTASLDEENKVLEGKILPDGVTTSPLDYAPVNETGGHLWSCNFAIQKILFNEFRGFDEYFKFPHLEDNDLNKRLVQAGYIPFFLKYALVVHPLRKISSGIKMGLYQEMFFYYNSKHGVETYYVRTVKSIIRVHGSMIKRNFFSMDLFRAFIIMFEHVLVFTINFKKWKKIYVGKSKS